MTSPLGHGLSKQDLRPTDLLSNLLQCWDGPGHPPQLLREGQEAWRGEDPGQAVAGTQLLSPSASQPAALPQLPLLIVDLPLSCACNVEPQFLHLYNGNDTLYSTCHEQ